MYSIHKAENVEYDPVSGLPSSQLHRAFVLSLPSLLSGVRFDVDTRAAQQRIDRNTHNFLSFRRLNARNSYGRGCESRPRVEF